METLASLSHPFWDHRFNLDAGRLVRPQMLVGSQRATDILINVRYPLTLHRGGDVWREFVRERGPAPAAVMRRTAARFFGNAADRILSFAAIQQGLLQIDRDDRTAPSPEAFREKLRAIDSLGAD